MKNGSVATNRIKNENILVEVSAHELNRGFVFLFGLSTLVLYTVNEWNDILDGRNDDLIIRIQRYLQSVQLSFLILYSIHYMRKNLFIMSTSWSCLSIFFYDFKRTINNIIQYDVTNKQKCIFTYRANTNSILTEIEIL